MTMKNRQRLILLVNLGTPDAPTAGAVRRYLAEFLHDYRVVDLSRWLWCILLHFIILPIRSGRVAGNYAKIWLPKGSPLLVYSQGLADKLQHQMPNTEVRLAMRYGNPSVPAVLADYPDLQELTVLPLYPQYSATTTASVFDAVTRYYLKQERVPNLRFIREYHRHPAWLDAMEARIRNHWDLHGRGERLLFSSNRWAATASKHSIWSAPALPWTVWKPWKKSASRMRICSSRPAARSCATSAP